MKKLALVIAMLVIAAFYVTPVTASDFSAGGAYRALAIYEDPGRGGEETQILRQRFRLAFNWAVNDNVSAQLRGDFAEMTWGDGYRPEQGSDTLMIDRAFVNIKQSWLNLTVGQQAGAWGLGTLWSDQFQGVQADLIFNPVTVQLLYVKNSEGGLDGNAGTDDDGNDDTDTYGVGIVYGSEAISGGLQWATRLQDSVAGMPTDDERSGIALYLTGKAGPVALSGELVFFDGDVGNTNMDYAGTQFHVAADMSFSEAFGGGLTFVWADGVDDDEVQLTAIADDAAFNPLDYSGALGWDRGLYGGSCSLFDVSGEGKGVIGIILDAQFAVSESLVLYGKLGYAEPSDDALTLDSNFYALANFDWTWMPAVTISGGVGYVDSDYNLNVIDDDPVLEFLFRLGVSF